MSDLPNVRILKTDGIYSIKSRVEMQIAGEWVDITSWTTRVEQIGAHLGVAMITILANTDLPIREIEDDPIIITVD